VKKGVKKEEKNVKKSEVRWKVKARPILSHISESVFSLPPYSPLLET